MKDLSILHRLAIPIIAPACFAMLLLITAYVIGGLIAASLVVAATGRTEAADPILRHLMGRPE